MKYKVSLLVLLLVATISHVVYCRPVRMWTYSDLTDEAGLIIIGTHKKSSDVKTKPDKLRSDPPVVGAVVGVRSTFNVLSVVKGKFPNKTLDIYHYRYENVASVPPNGWRFVEFPENDKTTYLMFLKKDEDKRFVAATGQRDPVDSFRAINAVRAGARRKKPAVLPGIIVGPNNTVSWEDAKRLLRETDFEIVATAHSGSVAVKVKGVYYHTKRPKGVDENDLVWLLKRLRKAGKRFSWMTE